MVVSKVDPLADHLARVRAAAERAQAKRESRNAKAPDHFGAVTAAREAAEAARQQALRGAWATLVPRRYRNASAGDFEAAAAEVLQRWAGAWRDGVNLFIFGPVGTGKTHAAFAAARGPFTEGAALKFWSEANFKEAIDWHVPDHAAVMADAMSVPVLIFDDLANSPNDWWGEKLEALVNQRWLDDLPTIFTSNLEAPKLRESLSERTVSRIADHAIALRLTGADRRRS